MPFITANNCQFYYEQYGEGPNLILISGLSADHNTWLSVVPHLSKNFRVLVFDNRGAGQSATPPGHYSSEMMAVDVVEIMKALVIQHAHIIGHSLGSYIAQWIGINFPDFVDKLVLICPKAYTDATGRLRAETSLKLMEAGVNKNLRAEIVMPWIFGNTFLSNPRNIRNFKTATLNNPYPQTEGGYKAQLPATLNHDTRDFLSIITAPTLIIAGSEDLNTPLNTVQQVAKKIPNSLLTIIEECGHIPQLEQPQQLITAMLDFL